MVDPKWASRFTGGCIAMSCWMAAQGAQGVEEAILSSRSVGPSAGSLRVAAPAQATGWGGVRPERNNRGSTPHASRPASGLAVGADRPASDAAVAEALDPAVAVALRWEVKASDVTLARTLERWCAAAGHKLKWDASRNFLIGAADVYQGSFEGALEQVLSSPGIRFSDYPLEACIYGNTPPLVRITRQGEQQRECLASSAGPAP